MAIFVVIPPVFIELGGITIGQLWQVYLPAILVALVCMIPAVMIIEKSRCTKRLLALLY